jgi:hypothetical protein
MGSHVVPKARLLRDLGFGGDLALAEDALHEAGLSHPGKLNIHPGKCDDVAAVIEERFLLVCGRGDCQGAARALAGERVIVPATAQPHCRICGGSAIQSAIEEMLAACRSAGWRRLCVVGGAPDSRLDLATRVAKRIELRLVLGTRSRTAKAARADTAWADLVVIWGATELAHKVSTLYTGPHVITVQRRGIEALAGAVTLAARRRS